MTLKEFNDMSLEERQIFMQKRGAFPIIHRKKENQDNEQLSETVHVTTVNRIIEQHNHWSKINKRRM